MFVYKQLYEGRFNELSACNMASTLHTRFNIFNDRLGEPGLP